MRIVGILAVLVAAALVAHVDAQQQADEPVSESLKQALQKPQTLNLSFRPELLWADPQPPKQFGMLTIVPPTTDGMAINVRIPIGELVMRASRAIAKARYQHAERQAHEEVQRALQEFFQAQARSVERDR
jgi:hypothetical protein